MPKQFVPLGGRCSVCKRLWLPSQLTAGQKPGVYICPTCLEKALEEMERPIPEARIFKSIDPSWPKYGGTPAGWNVTTKWFETEEEARAYAGIPKD